MNKIVELKQKLEQLKQEKINNEEIVKKIQNDNDNLSTINNSINHRLKELEELLFEYKKNRRIKKFILAIIILNIILAFTMFALSRGIGTENFIFKIMLAFFLFNNTIISATFKEYGEAVRFLQTYDLKSIQNRIKKKQKDKDLNEQKLKMNTQKLVELNETQTLLNLEIQDYETKLMNNKETKSQEINEFLNNLLGHLGRIYNNQDKEEINESKGYQKIIKK